LVKWEPDFTLRKQIWQLFHIVQVKCFGQTPRNYAFEVLKGAKVSGSEPEKPANATGEGAVQLYCIAAMVADEASSNGHADFARGLEQLLQGLLSTLPREQQGHALRLSYELALRGDDAAPPRLRLVHSRD
jgi:hypothetical protein